MFEAIANGMDHEGQQIHGREHYGEVLFAVTKLRLKTIVVGFEGIEACVFDLPSDSGTGHKRGNHFFRHRKRGHQGIVGRDLGIGDGDADPVHQHRSLAIVHRHVLKSAIPVGHSLTDHLGGDLARRRTSTMHEVIQDLVRGELDGHQTVVTGGSDRFSDQLAGEKVVAQVDWPFIIQVNAMKSNLAFGAITLTILLLSVVPGSDEHRHYW